MRIQKYFSQEGILSRRETEKYIRAGKISVNGEIIKDLGRQIDPARDKVEIVGGKKRATDKKETVIINKPRGIVSSRIKSEGKTVYDLFPQYKHLHIAGRLDKDSEGLLLLTNDGVLAKKLTSEAHVVEKEYRVFVREAVRPNVLSIMSRGMRLPDGMTLPAKTKRTGAHEFTITLMEGRNHQIRRMADAVHLTVGRLVRVRIGPLTLGTLKSGEARALSSNEIDILKKT